MIKKELFIKQLNEIISDFEALNRNSRFSDLSDHLEGDLNVLFSLISRCKAAAHRIVGPHSSYYYDILFLIEKSRNHDGLKLKSIVGVIYGLKNDLEKDYLKNLHELIQSEVFSDYLEMAEYLLSEGYKNASAVIIGSTLEAHLRELCKKSEIETDIKNSKDKLVSIKAETMNSELTKKSVYSSLIQKQVTSWLALRNSAAHGRYDDYNEKEISIMLLGIRQFIIQTSE